MRTPLLLLVLAAGCGGSSVSTHTGYSAFEGTFSGRGYVNFTDTGSARVAVAQDGEGVVTLSDIKGRQEDWIVFVSDDGSFTGDQFEQGKSEGVSGKMELQGSDLVVTLKMQYRQIGAVIRAKRTQ